MKQAWLWIYLFISTHSHWKQMFWLGTAAWGSRCGLPRTAPGCLSSCAPLITPSPHIQNPALRGADSLRTGLPCSQKTDLGGHLSGLTGEGEPLTYCTPQQGNAHEQGTRGHRFCHMLQSAVSTAMCHTLIGFPSERAKYLAFLPKEGTEEKVTVCVTGTLLSQD